VANITFDLCRGELQDVEDVKHLKATLAEDEIAYRENIKDVGPYTSISDLSNSWGDIGVDTYIDLSLSWTS
jgi:hypothetical protein